MLRMIDRHLKGGEHQWLVRRPNSLSERYLWPTHDWMRRFCAETPLPEIAGRCMGSAWARLLFRPPLLSEAGGSDDTPWHQDLALLAGSRPTDRLRLGGPHPLRPESSGLQFVRGSHNWGKMHRPVQGLDASKYRNVSAGPASAAKCYATPQPAPCPWKEAPASHALGRSH